MDAKEIREHLGRVRTNFQRNDMVRALASAVMALKGIVTSAQPPSTELRSLLRDAVQYLVRDENIKALLPAPLIYQPGQERALLTQLAAVYKAVVEEAAREDVAVARSRKLKLDQALNAGMKALAQNQAPEADQCFSEAVANYRDEHRVFVLIGKALLDAKEVRRAIPYLKRGLEVAPADATVRELLETAVRLKTETPAG